jgi:hypothetical protein
MSVYSEPWYKDHVAKAERGNREHVARYDRSFLGALAKADASERGDGGDLANHPVVQLATLLIGSGKFASYGDAFHHLLNTSHGAALLHRTRTHKAAKETFSMTSTSSHAEFVQSVVKKFGIVALAKSMVQHEKSYGLDEHTFTQLATEHASRLYPNDRPDSAFSKLYESEESVRRACQLAKENEFASLLLDYMPHVVAAEAFRPQVISGGEMADADDRQQAWEALAEIGRRLAPTATPERQFALAFEDPKNISLANRVHVRPTPPAGGVYAFSTAATAKSDHDFGAPTVDSAYAALMRKAEEYRSAHPELSVAQCFEKIYTDRANVELAKRERIESAPR